MISDVVSPHQAEQLERRDGGAPGDHLGWFHTAVVILGDKRDTSAERRE